MTTPIEEYQYLPLATEIPPVGSVWIDKRACDVPMVVLDKTDERERVVTACKNPRGYFEIVTWRFDRRSLRWYCDLNQHVDLTKAAVFRLAEFLGQEQEP